MTQPTELLKTLTNNLTTEPYEQTYQIQKIETLLHKTAELCTQLRLQNIKKIIETSAQSTQYEIHQKTRTERRVNTKLLHDEKPEIYQACVYLETADAKRLLGGTKALYQLANNKAPDRTAELEQISLRELDNHLSPQEQKRYVTAIITTIGNPCIIRRETP